MCLPPGAHFFWGSVMYGYLLYDTAYTLAFYAAVGSPSARAACIASAHLPHASPHVCPSRTLWSLNGAADDILLLSSGLIHDLECVLSRRKPGSDLLDGHPACTLAWTRCASRPPGRPRRHDILPAGVLVRRGPRRTPDPVHEPPAGA
jgi:hypothetical protein